MSTFLKRKYTKKKRIPKKKYTKKSKYTKRRKYTKRLRQKGGEIPITTKITEFISILNEHKDTELFKDLIKSKVYDPIMKEDPNYNYDNLSEIFNKMLGLFNSYSDNTIEEFINMKIGGVNDETKEIMNSMIPLICDNLDNFIENPYLVTIREFKEEFLNSLNKETLEQNIYANIINKDSNYDNEKLSKIYNDMLVLFDSYLDKSIQQFIDMKEGVDENTKQIMNQIIKLILTHLIDNDANSDDDNSDDEDEENKKNEENNYKFPSWLDDPPLNHQPSSDLITELIKNSQTFYDSINFNKNIDDNKVHLLDEYNTINKTSISDLKLGNRIQDFSSENHEEIVLFANNTRPIFHSKLISLMNDFINLKQPYYGDIYKNEDKTNITYQNLVERLLTKRPITFYTKNDVYMLRDGSKGSDNYNPKLDDYINYDEMAISALLSVSVPTFFINNGQRNNFGIKETDDSKYEKYGVYVGSVGARFERPGNMEWAHMIVSRDQNTSEKGYGSTPSTPNDLLNIWAKFYEVPHFPLYTEINTADYISLPNGNYLNIEIYKKRIRMVIEPFLMDANDRIHLFKNKKKVYVHAVGLGLGFWALNSFEQTKLIIEVYIQVLTEIPFINIYDIDFSYFDAVPDKYKTQEMPPLNPHINLHFSKRNPADPIHKEDTLLVAQYAWDGNSYPGNEYWDTALNASGDPAAACCSLISELQNPQINVNFVKPNRFYIVGGKEKTPPLPHPPSNPPPPPPPPKPVEDLPKPPPPLPKPVEDLPNPVEDLPNPPPVPPPPPPRPKDCTKEINEYTTKSENVKNELEAKNKELTDKITELQNLIQTLTTTSNDQKQDFEKKLADAQQKINELQSIPIQNSELESQLKTKLEELQKQLEICQKSTINETNPASDSMNGITPVSDPISNSISNPIISSNRDYLNGIQRTKGTLFINDMISCQVKVLQDMKESIPRYNNDDVLINDYLENIKKCKLSKINVNVGSLIQGYQSQSVNISKLTSEQQKLIQDLNNSCSNNNDSDTLSFNTFLTNINRCVQTNPEKIDEIKGLISAYKNSTNS